MILTSSVRSELFNPLSFMSQRGAKEYCNNCVKGKESSYRVESSIQGLNSRKQDESVDITVTYMGASGNFKVRKVKSSDLSSSWMWQSSVDRNHAPPDAEEGQKGSYQQTINNKLEEINYPSTDQSQLPNPVSPVKLRRQQLRKKRKERRSAELIQMSKETELQMESAAILRTKQFKNTVKGKYSIWRKEYKPPSSDSVVKLMKDQIIMAKVYATIAFSLKKVDMYDFLMKHVKESQQAIGVANSDAELQFGALEQAKAIGHALTHAKDVLYDCEEVARKLQVMVQSSEGSIHATKKQNTFLIQHAAKTIPKTLHCLPLQLATDYFLHNNHSQEPVGKDKLVDNSLYHYAIFSDNVLAASVVVNSTMVHAKEPEKHVFHIVTDKLNYAAMKMWFIAYPPSPATVHVDNIDEFKWLNSSYCSVLRQLESNRIKEYYFKANHPSSLSAGNENLKYRNPKYLSMLNHLRFYMPEVYPKLDKILFLDDDIVVQKDLTPLWSIDMKGMVNGAVETCKESFHRFDTYLNFSNPMISENFDPQACGWAFGMNIFDLKEWKKRNITGIYHYWQDSNEDRKLWKLGSLPPGLITFYNLTYPLERNWHVLGLGYDPAVNTADIKEAAVIHYNGNYKPWLDLAISKYRKYWSKFVPVDNPYLQRCYIEQ
ncbi:putative galacturonosyltransferase 3 [Iris pallida]|uniref:Hexosyltransferase n=1 Tax=Iris pallida TaxID=29817 RepID=A0AAX6FV01_IRIPA|nr:putative galacturonosyltransferase 3 [Iris pallida]